MKQKIRAIAVDDEEHCIDTLKWELSRTCPEVEIVGSTTKESDTKRLINETLCDLIFMDIHLQTISGIELIRSLQPLDCDVIFVTAYDKYAVKAFEVAATNYLLKPISSVKLRMAIDRLVESRMKQSNEILQGIIQELAKSNDSDTKIAFHVQNSIEFIRPKDIIFVKGENNYSTLYFTDGNKLVLSKTLGVVEKTLENFAFYRTHKSYLVNLEYIERYIKADGGYIEMMGGHHVGVSRTKKSSIHELYK